jgi:hypothetical protein
MRLQYPNWAAKYFVDAVLLAHSITGAGPT